MNTLKLGPFLGMDNRRPDAKLATEDGAYLRNAVNVDLGPDGHPRRRQGTTRLLGGDDCHSFWSRGADGYYVDYATLYHVDPVPTRTPLLTGLTPGLRMSYTATPQGVVVSNGSGLWMLDGATATPCTLETPRFAPLLDAGTGGALPGGRYQVAVAYVGDDGQVSGTTAPQQVEVPDDGVLTLLGLPAAQPCAVYLTPPDGDTFYRVATTLNVSLTFSTLPDYGARCQTLLLQPMPPGGIVRYHNGRLLTASGDLLSYSEPYALALHDPAKGFVAFPADITLVEPCGDGVFVSTTETTYYLRGEISQAVLDEVLPYPAVPGASATLPNSREVCWMSARGWVRGTPDGQAQNLQEQHVAVQPAQVGAALFREQNGMQQLLATLFGPQATIAAARTYMDAEIIRQGETL